MYRRDLSTKVPSDFSKRECIFAECVYVVSNGYVIVGYNEKIPVRVRISVTTSLGAIKIDMSVIVAKNLLGNTRNFTEYFVFLFHYMAKIMIFL